VLWSAAAVVMFLAIRSARTDPCAPHSGVAVWLALVGVGVLTASAAFSSLHSVRRRLVALIVSLCLGAAATLVLYFTLLLHVGQSLYELTTASSG
jgi:hypothetical protein